MGSNPEQINVRIPGDLRAWLRQQTQLNRSSLSSEVTRCIRERMSRNSPERTNPAQMQEAQQA